ncbi:MAG: tRNA uridine-5-carboxymethylaminomethyl(34) synthesis GTPase MnmE [Christensenellales bacterium]
MTVYALSTPPGQGGIAIIRISGPDAILVLRAVFSPFPKKPNHLVYGTIKDGKRIVDHCMAVFFQEPASYTGEDMAEIHCHGSMIVAGDIMAILEKNGANQAQPGEFTKRAFINGKMDLSQSEGVMELIGSLGQKSAQAALDQLEGGLSRKIRDCRDKLLKAISTIEAAIEYPEEDWQQEEKVIGKEIEDAEKALIQLKNSFRTGRILHDGLKVAIVGKPNVGKSSILNALLGKNRAIVTAHAGTTRDVLEEAVQVDGVPVRIMDTAGIREGAEEIEQLGIGRAREALKAADLALFVLDTSEALTQQDIEVSMAIETKSCIVALNKSDAGQLLSEDDVRRLLPGAVIVTVSALKGEGIELLAQEIRKQAVGEELPSATVITLRHKKLVDEALKAVQDAILHRGEVGSECVSIDLQAACSALGEITGENTTEELIETIFCRFCLGK